MQQVFKHTSEKYLKICIIRPHKSVFPPSYAKNCYHFQQFMAFTPFCRASRRLAVSEKVTTFAAMFISKIPKYRERPDGTIEKYYYFRLSENWRNAEGKVRKRTVLNLGELPGYTKVGRDRKSVV